MARWAVPFQWLRAIACEKPGGIGVSAETLGGWFTRPHRCRAVVFRRRRQSKSVSLIIRVGLESCNSGRRVTSVMSGFWPGLETMSWGSGMNSTKVYSGIMFLALIFLAPLAGLTGCTSEASRERAQQADAKRKVAEDDEDLKAKEGTEEADRALMLQAQQKLDAVEQRRSNNVYAHSCRKVTLASYALNATNVDTSGCSADRLKLEQDAERQQSTSDLFKKP